MKALLCKWSHLERYSVWGSHSDEREAQTSTHLHVQIFHILTLEQLRRSHMLYKLWKWSIVLKLYQFCLERYVCFWCEWRKFVIDRSTLCHKYSHLGVTWPGDWYIQDQQYPSLCLLSIYRHKLNTVVNMPLDPHFDKARVTRVHL